MKIKPVISIIVFCTLSCPPALGRFAGSFILEEAVQYATDVVLLEQIDGEFVVVENLVGDIEPGSVLNCLDLCAVDSTQYTAIPEREKSEFYNSPTDIHPIYLEGYIFVPEGMRLVYFLQAMKADAPTALIVAETEGESAKIFTSVSQSGEGTRNSLVWCSGEEIYNFTSLFSDGDPSFLSKTQVKTENDSSELEPLSLKRLGQMLETRTEEKKENDNGYFPLEEIEWLTKLKRLRKAYQFRETKLRLFGNGEVAGSNYEIVTGKILGTRIILEEKGANKPGALLYVPYDQPDAAVRNALTSVLMWKGSQHTYLGITPRTAKRIQILSCFDVPIEGAKVKVWMQHGYQEPDLEPVLLGERTTDANGFMDIVSLPQDISDYENNWNLAPLQIEHPEYGLTQVRYSYSSEIVRTSLIREDNEARERALRGVVLDSNQKPVSGALVTSNSIRPPGLLISGMGTAITDEEGRFCLYLFRQHWAPQIEGESLIVPPHSKYLYRVTPPESSKLMKAGGWASNDEPVTITLESISTFEARSTLHTFKFEGGFPESPGPADGGVQVAIRSTKGGFGVNLVHPDEEHRLPYGTYYAWISRNLPDLPNSQLNFKPITVNEDSPEELNFEIANLRCSGSVVNGITGEPMSQVLCLVSDKSWFPLNLSFNDLPEDFSETVAPSEIKGFPLLTTVVTDETGHFEIDVPEGARIGLVYAVADGFVSAGRHVYIGNPSTTDLVTLNPIPLYPAGQASLRFKDDDESGTVHVVWKADEQATEDWAFPLKSNEDRSLHSLEIMTASFDTGVGKTTFDIPAQVPLHITVNPPQGDLVRTSLTAPVTVQPRQSVDLGEVKFEQCVKVTARIKVVDEAGKPLEGIPIRKLEYNVWNFPSLTDKNGIATFEVKKGITESVKISGPEITYDVDRESKDTNPIEHTFTLTDEEQIMVLTEN